MVTTRHNEELLTVVRRATRKLDSEPETVEMFVEHLTFLARTTTEMPSLESEYLTVTRLVMFAVESTCYLFQALVF